MPAPFGITLGARSFLRALSHFAFALLVPICFASSAEASPIQLNLKITYYTPKVGPHVAGFGFYMFESASNDWPGGNLPDPVAVGGGTIGPGVTTYALSLPIADASTLYFLAYGGFQSGPDSLFRSIFVAEPPGGYVPDDAAYVYGPPWISLASLGSGVELSGDLWVIYGYSNQGGSWLVGTWEATTAETTTAPEPATILLLCPGLAAVIVRRRWMTRS